MSENKVTEIARKWYVKIGFPEKFDAMFNALLEEEKPESVPFEKYNASENSKGKTFIMYLYFCEQLSEKYKEAGISEKILMATLDDFIINTEREYILSGELGLVKPSVLKNHLSMRLFRIGRLQFCMDGAARDIPEKGIEKGENVIDVHIPAGDSLSMEECKRDFAAAEEFFVKYFPEYDYRYYTCFSWMLDKNLKSFLNENSNILKFQNFFEVVYEFEYDSALHFVFKYGIKDRSELETIEAQTSFAKKLKQYALSGGKLYNNFGVREREFIGTEIEQ